MRGGRREEERKQGCEPETWKETEIREARKRDRREGKGGNRDGEAAKGERQEEMWLERLKGTHGEPHKDVMGRETL